MAFFPDWDLHFAQTLGPFLRYESGMERGGLESCHDLHTMLKWQLNTPKTLKMDV